MGNSWADYTALDPAVFDRIMATPQSVDEATYRAMVQRVCEHRRDAELALAARGAGMTWDQSASAQSWGPRDKYVAMTVQSTYAAKAELKMESELSALLDPGAPGEPGRVPVVGGVRHLTGREGGLLVLDLARADAAGELHTWDVLHRIAPDWELEREITTPAEREAWARLVASLGYPRSPYPVPWWLLAAYPAMHFLSVIPPAELTSIVAALQGTGVGARAVRLSGTHTGLTFVLPFLEAQAPHGRWIVAVESA